MSKTIAICVATYRRQVLLERLMDSLYRLVIPEVWTVEVRVVDNDPDGSAKAVIEGKTPPSWLPSGPSYVVEPRQGIAEARNAALDQGTTDFVLFVDDDEEVPANWVAALASCAENTGADVTLGPVTGRLPKESPPWMTRGKFFDKEVGSDGTPLDWRSGRTSNTLVAGRWFFEMGHRFDASFSRSGGSDCELFRRLASHGATFVACDSARVQEDVEPDRATVKWMMLRSYRNGMIYQRVAQEKLVPLRALWRTAKAAVLVISGMIPSILGRHEKLVRALNLVALAAGGVVAWSQPERAKGWVAYVERPIDSVSSLKS